MLALTKWSETVNAAFEEHAPHKICQFVYELSDTFNKFYHDEHILVEDEKEKTAKVAVLETAIDLLGLEAPERM